MYRYDDYDRTLVRERVAQFRNQTERFLAGQLSVEEFRFLRVQNGLYIQRHAPMLRIAVPYGLLSSTQLRGLAHVARRYDRGYGHFTTRLNFQLNWPELPRVPDILAELAEVEMHAIQTSGNCIRNTTVDPLAGVGHREVADPRPWAEIIRQWSTLHPEFAYLPRKFKIAVSGGPDDDANVRIHDMGFQLVRRDDELGFRVWVGGGLGRTPILAQVINGFLPWQHLITYAEAVMRVYNRFGRRDNPFKARIKILVKALGAEEFARQVEAEWAHTKYGPATLTQTEVDRVSAYFTQPPYQTSLPATDGALDQARRNDKAFDRWVENSVHAHRVVGYVAVTLSLKAPGRRPGDITSEQLESVAGLAERFSFGEVRITQTQNIILPDIRCADLYLLWQELVHLGLATPATGLLTDITCCPGGDLCELANARSVPIANGIQALFTDQNTVEDIGELKLNISGCMNACGHHHVGHIGVLGVDKQGKEFYQVTLGGAWGMEAALGKVIGPSLAANDVPGAVSRIVEHYRSIRNPGERFIDTLRRAGVDGFKAEAYRNVSPAEQEREAVNA